jgi:RNA polymerase sigma-70 factor (ECF subfamily)
MTGRADQSLLRSARQGSIEAFAELFEPLRATAVAVATRYVGTSDAEDVVMDAFLKAWQGLPQFRGQRLKSWLLQIVRRAALDRIRSRARRHSVSLDAPASGSPQHDPAQTPSRDISDPTAATPDETATQHETVRNVQLAMTQLSDLYRISLQLRYTDNLSYSEIADATGVSIGTVMSRLHNGKRRLRQLLASSYEATP